MCHPNHCRARASGCCFHSHLEFIPQESLISTGPCQSHCHPHSNKCREILVGNILVSMFSHHFPMPQRPPPALQTALGFWDAPSTAVPLSITPVKLLQKGCAAYPEPPGTALAYRACCMDVSAPAVGLLGMSVITHRRCVVSATCIWLAGLQIRLEYPNYNNSSRF